MPTWLAKRKERMFDCGICVSRASLNDMSTSSCVAAHRVCFECAKDHVSASLDGGTSVVRCPVAGNVRTTFRRLMWRSCLAAAAGRRSALSRFNSRRTSPLPPMWPSAPALTATPTWR